jgi:hypothetical protein
MEPTTPHILCLARHDQPHWKQDISKIQLCGIWVAGGPKDPALADFLMEYYIPSEDLRERTPDLPSEGTAIQALVNWIETSIGLGVPVMLAGMNTAFTLRWLRAALTRAGYGTCPFMAQSIDLHSLAVCYALHQKRPVPEVGFSQAEIFDLVELPQVPLRNNANYPATWQAAALRLLLGLDK